MPDLGPRRTREHVIASQSHNYVEKFFIDKGHTIDYVTDYGTDAVVNTFDENGYAEGGDIRLQLKASDNLDYSADGEYISCSIDVSHYHYWMKQVYPVFLVLYDAQRVRAYWLYVQAYFASSGGKRPRKNAQSITVRVPTKNRMTSRAVDYMRNVKARILEVDVEHQP